MGFYRIAGALILAVSGIGGAYWLNQSATASLRQVEAWLALLRYVKTQVECFSLPVSEILRRADPQLLRGCGYMGTMPPRSFEALLTFCAIRDGETEQLIRSFAEEFGKSYREEQSRGCDYYFSLLDARREGLVSQLPAKKRINSALCVSGALALVILLI